MSTHRYHRSCSSTQTPPVTNGTAFATPFESSTGRRGRDLDPFGSLRRMTNASNAATAVADVSDPDVSSTLRILVVGDMAVEKSVLIRRFCLEQYYFCQVYPRHAAFIRQYRAAVRETQSFEKTSEEEIRDLKRNINTYIDTKTKEHTVHARISQGTQFDVAWVSLKTNGTEMNSSTFGQDVEVSEGGNLGNLCQHQLLQPNEGTWVEFILLDNDSSKEARKIFYEGIHGIMFVFDASQPNWDRRRKETSRRWMSEFIDCDQSTEGGISAMTSLERVLVLSMGIVDNTTSLTSEERHVDAGIVRQFSGYQTNDDHTDEVVFASLFPEDQSHSVERRSGHDNVEPEYANAMHHGTLAILNFLEDIVARSGVPSFV